MIAIAHVHLRSTPFVASLTVALLGSPCHAGLIEGRADSGGYTQPSQKACCASVILAAQEYAAEVCRKTGGFPASKRDPDRGQCNWDERTDDSGNPLFQCSATSALDCTSP